MEAMAALGLAANIVQFVDFGFKIAKGGAELLKSGDGLLKSLTEIRKEADEHSILFQKVISGPLVHRDRPLAQIVRECLNASKELANLIESLRVRSGKSRHIEAAGKSFETFFKASEIKRLQGRLDRIRDLLCSHLLVLISEQQAALPAAFVDLAELTRSGNSEVQGRLDILSSQLEMLINKHAWSTVHQEAAFSSVSENLRILIEEAENTKKVAKILKSLHFTQMKERHSDIRDAHRATFNWIFDPETSVNLASWLASEIGIYWVEGKAGSGKSTAMKYIVRDPRTTTLLQRWAGPKKVTHVSHFFWNAGTKMQRSQDGLFRTLLFQTFATFPEIVPVVCSTRWSNPLNLLDGWHRTELLDAMTRLANIEDSPAKICLFVDGLDEYDGDHVELIEILRVIANSPNIKICVSSRPWTDFVDAFESQEWKLRVQDLTIKDIQIYITDHLEENERFKRIQLQDPEAAQSLVDEIRSKAQGVFLWVFLVVRSLLKGLRNVDGISDLRRRLKDLPGELERYFEHMLNSIEQIYRQKMARVLKIMATARYRLPIYAFYALDQLDELGPSFVLDGEIVPVSDQALTLMAHDKKRQLHAQCGDLLWVTHHDNTHGIQSDTVDFLHRTVFDYLQTTEMELFFSERMGECFRPKQTLGFIHLAMTQAAQRGTWLNLRPTALGTVIYSYESEMETEEAEVALLDTLDGSICSRVQDWRGISASPSFDNLLALTIRCGMTHYVKEKVLERKGSPMPELLDLALQAKVVIDVEAWSIQATNTIDLSMVELLLEAGLNPNDRSSQAERTAWGRFLQRLSPPVQSTAKSSPIKSQTENPQTQSKAQKPPYRGKGRPKNFPPHSRTQNPPYQGSENISLMKPKEHFPPSQRRINNSPTGSRTQSPPYQGSENISLMKPKEHFPPSQRRINNSPTGSRTQSPQYQESTNISLMKPKEHFPPSQRRINNSPAGSRTQSPQYQERTNSPFHSRTHSPQYQVRTQNPPHQGKENNFPVQSNTKSASVRLDNVYEACQLMINSGASREVEFLNRTTEKLESKRVEDALGAIFRVDEVQSLMALYTSREIKSMPTAGASILTRIMQGWWGQSQS